MVNIWTQVVLAVAPLVAPPAVGGDVLAIRVGRAETIAHGPIENAVILVEDGLIGTVGEDLVIQRGIPVLERPDWVALPGLVNAYSRLGLEGGSGSDSTPQAKPLREIYARDPVFEELTETGVTTLVLYPAGTGIPGQAVAIRPGGGTIEDMLVDDSAYVKIFFRSNSRAKKMIRDAFKKVDDYNEKEKKAREKYEKDKEKAEKSKSKSKKKEEPEEPKEGDDKGGDTKAEGDKEELGPYVPPEPDEDVVPFIQLRAGDLKALISIADAGDYLHLLDAIGEEEFQWDLRVPATRELNLFEIAERLGEKQVRLVMEPELSLHPGTLRQRNLPAELSRAGAALVLVPRNDSIAGFKSWLADTGRLVGTGLEREVALRALTLEPAIMIGLGERLGSIEKGKDANLIFMSGDPFEPSSRLEAVMLEGQFIHGEVMQ